MSEHVNTVPALAPTDDTLPLSTRDLPQALGVTATAGTGRDGSLDTASADAPAESARQEENVGADGDRPEIHLTMKRLPEAAAAARTALAAHNSPPTLFEHGGELVRLQSVGGAGPTLLPLRPADLQVELSYAARWFECGNSGTKPIYPPPLVVQDLMGRSAGWAPPLREVTRVPRPRRGLAIARGTGLPAGRPDLLPARSRPPAAALVLPSQHDVAEARRLLTEELLGQFPFALPCHRAAAVAALLVPFVRHRIEGATPLHLFDSPQPGTGKTLLADAVAIPALGREPAANTEIASGDDLRKWVTAMALAGERVVLIDNVNARLGGSALAAALTKVEWSDRIIGTSRMARGSVRCLWLATGNNVTVTGELARRVVRCRLDAGVSRPYLRGGFRHPDLRVWAKGERHRLIWAALTLVLHWVARGRPAGTRLLGSYEGYCRVIGGILETGGIEGFLADLGAEQGRCDDETAEWAVFVAAWRERFGDARVAAQNLDTAVLTPNPEMLAVALASTSSRRGRRIKLGQELRKRRDAVLAGCRVRVSDTMDRHGCWHYWLEPLDADNNMNDEDNDDDID